jgi:hypothetical protein
MLLLVVDLYEYGTSSLTLNENQNPVESENTIL